MKLILPFLALFFIIHSTSAQQISRDILTTAGGVAKNTDGVSLSWTIGDVFSQTTLSEQHLTEGFQQGDFVKKTSEEIPNHFSDHPHDPTTTVQKDHSIQITTYPNPTIDHLVISFASDSSQVVNAYIFDEVGNFLLQKRIEVENGKEVILHQIQNMSAGKYFIRFVKNGKTISAQTFLKVKL